MAVDDMSSINLDKMARTNRIGEMISTNTFEQPRHPIQVVSRRTGLTADVLRAWERRYQAVTPGRTETGRRLYSDADIERLVLLKRAAGAGRSIAQVAALSSAELASLVQEDETIALQSPPRGSSGVNESNAWVAECLAAVERYDGIGLRRAIAAASLELSESALIDRLLGPLMHEVGERWHSGTLRVAHEHLATATVQWYLGELTRRHVRPDAPTIVMAAPAGQRHQVGAMLAAAAAISEGWRVVYLGSDLPAEEIASAATHSKARCVGLSIVYPADDPLLAGELTTLRRLLPSGVTIIAGGKSAAAYLPQLREVNAEHLTDLTAFRAALDQLGLAA